MGLSSLGLLDLPDPDDDRFELFGFTTRASLVSFCLPSNGPVAQRLEQGTHNPLVLGSNPSGPTIIRKKVG